MTVLKFFTLLAIGILSLTLDSSSCFAENVSTQTCLLVPPRAVNKIPVGMEFYQFDSTPLGHREPVVLIHGLLGESHPYFRWQKLAQYLGQDIQFRNRYKIYLARYNTQSPREELTRTFIADLHDFSRGHSITIVTISMSGAIIHDAMKDPAINKSITKVLTLGAFFQGSPLFCSDWMKQTIRKTHLFPLTKEERVLAYDLYFSRHKNLLADYKWRDTNWQVRSNIQLPSSFKEPGDEVSSNIDQKFVVYAGFIRSEYFPIVYGRLHQFVVSPLTFIFTTLPAHLGFEHSALRFLNSLIASSALTTNDMQDDVYALNDGISPISSGLLLAHSQIENTKFDGDDYFTYLKEHSNARKARVFANVDHLTFIEGRGLNQPFKAVTDVLSKDEKPRPIFAWILTDLLEE
ncbi:MAG: hypothetical protein P4L53_19865 [Candidatus Obscuribacterales bacterium]|nr:hypothetical protein [Candidatus Obscuribacterales bacterium]